jgi:actin related protein 2/3 complex subunit 3
MLLFLTTVSFEPQCLRKCEHSKDRADAAKTLQQLATEQFSIPGDSAFPLGGMIHAPTSREESGTCILPLCACETLIHFLSLDQLRQFFKQMREEISLRMLEVIYSAEGVKNKWWMSFSKRKFMNKQL